MSASFTWAKLDLYALSPFTQQSTKQDYQFFGVGTFGRALTRLQAISG